MSKLRGLLWAGMVAGLGVAAAAGLPRLARHVPWGVERWLGTFGASGAEAGVCSASAPATASLQRVLRRLYPLATDDRNVDIDVQVIRGDTVNAYATLGGHIFVFDGLLQEARTPEELAGVLAHEIEHVRQRHIVQGAVVALATWGGLRAVFGGSGNGVARTLLSLSFSREQEAEADEQGLQRLRAAQVDAAGFAHFFERGAQSAALPALLSSHPSDPQRAERAAHFRGYPTRPVLAPEEWAALRGICGSDHARR
ncbi:MAG: M48 family metallopeptidase [Proteobacteria bacterium]|nr:M48 family metallopeptidase [Pseudomonadota bacterium]